MERSTTPDPIVPACVDGEVVVVVVSTLTAGGTTVVVPAGPSACTVVAFRLPVGLVVVVPEPSSGFFLGGLRFVLVLPEVGLSGLRRLATGLVVCRFK